MFVCSINVNILLQLITTEVIKLDEVTEHGIFGLRFAEY